MTAPSATNPGWRRSSFCGDAGCLEVMYLPTGVLVRLEEDHDVITFVSFAEWNEFVASVKDGEHNFAVLLPEAKHPGFAGRIPREDVVLFLKGVKVGEFDRDRPATAS